MVSICREQDFVSSICRAQAPKAVWHGRACAGFPGDIFRASHVPLSPGADQGVVIY